MFNQEQAELYGETIYQGRSEEHAYISKIIDVVVGPRTTDLQFDYEIPPQSTRGKVRIWEGMTVDLYRDPILTIPLEDAKGSVKIVTAATNFNRGAYVISISADENLNSIAATATLLNGQPIVTSSSFIAVTAKASTYISTVFSNPTNITAIKEADWAVIYEGSELGQGPLLGEGVAPLDDTSGVITVKFSSGTLESGKTYNVCLSVGPKIPTISAAYVFKYLLL